MKTVLLTGGAGFIGFHTAQALLTKGYRVICIDNLNEYYDASLKRARLKILNQYTHFSFHKIDITDYHAMDKMFRGVDKVCHLAAQAGVRYSVEQPLTYDRSNIIGTFTIFELCVKHRVRHVVAASSSSVYGASRKVPFSESDPTEYPLSTYAATKRGTEHIGYCYSKNRGIRVTMLRFFTVYGPWGRPDMALFKFMKNILAGKPIDVYNRGKMRRDFTYVTDIVAGIVAAIEHPFRYEVFNLGNSKSVELMHLIECVERSLGKRAKKRMLGMQRGDVPVTYADIRKAKRMLGYEPRTDVEEGVQRFVDWYRGYYGVA